MQVIQLIGSPGQPLPGVEEHKQGWDHPGIDDNVVIFMVGHLQSLTLDFQAQ